MPGRMRDATAPNHGHSLACTAFAAQEVFGLTWGRHRSRHPVQMLTALNERIDQLPALEQRRFVGFTLALILAAAVVASFDFVPILDHINLAFHEAGHPLFGLFGETLGWLGGSLGQFVFPLATTVHFLRRQQYLSAAACAIWLFENLRYVALYLGDAQTQALPLVGGGQHDWTHLLSLWGVLAYDRQIAGALTALSWSGWVLVWALVALWWWRSRQRLAEQAQNAERERIIAQAKLRADQRRRQGRNT